MKNPVERLSGMLLGGDAQKAALIFSERNRRYFTQFPATDGALFITADKAYLLMDFRYEEAAHYGARNCEVIGFDSLMEKLQELIRKHGVKAVYLETETLSVAQAQRFEKAFAAAGAEALLTPELDSGGDPEDRGVPGDYGRCFRAYPPLHQGRGHRAGAGAGDRILHAAPGRGKRCL